jgi:hypothetical protein
VEVCTPLKYFIPFLQVHEYCCEESFRTQVEFHFPTWLPLIFYPVVQRSFSGPQTHEISNSCMHLHLVLEELCLWVFQYHLGYQFNFRFTQVVPFYPIGVLLFLHIIMGFFGFFPHAIHFFLGFFPGSFLVLNLSCSSLVP